MNLLKRSFLLSLSICFGLIAAGILLLPGSQPRPVAAQSDRPPLPIGDVRPDVDYGPLPLTPDETRRFEDSYAAVRRQSAPKVAVLVELTDMPSVQVYARSMRSTGQNVAQAAVQAKMQLALIEQRQQRLGAALSSLGAQEIYRTQRVYNGIAVLVDSRQIAEIEGLPGVKAVHPLIPHTVDTSRSVPFLGIPETWDLIRELGLAGERISIGIIDTGIDYLHADFGGPGSGYSDNDPTVITDTPGGVAFPTVKIVGGYDFVGDDYDAGNPDQAVPHPDPDPMDCFGHGTHVAGIAAGYGVQRNGATYTGSFSSTLAFADFVIGPGVAPQADLYALKIFGCQGASTVTNQAIEWAVDPNGDGDFSDHLDVINLSVGSSFGSIDDPSTVASNNAALADVVVVAAAGNAGDTYYVVNSPGVADRAISVASSTLDGVTVPRSNVREVVGGSVAPTADSLSSFSARGPRRLDASLKPDIAAPGDRIVSARAGSGNGALTIGGTSMATPHVAGAMALLRQLRPGWSVEELKAVLINSARYDIRAGNSATDALFGLGRAGAGRLDLPGAVRSGVIAYDAQAPGLVSLSFGRADILGQTTMLKNVRLVNKEPVTRTFYVTYSGVVDMPGVDVGMLANPIMVLAPNGAVNVPVWLNADASQMKRIRESTLTLGAGLPRQWFGEEAGHLYFWPVTTHFRAELTGDQEQPPVESQYRGQVDFAYDPLVSSLIYTLSVTSTGALSEGVSGLTAAHLHIGLARERGPLLGSMLPTGAQLVPGAVITGDIHLSPAEARLLAGSALYVNVHSEAFPNGELRGQVEPLDAIPRLPVYAAPRPVSLMRSAKATVSFGTAFSATQSLVLTGAGVQTASSLSAARYPTDSVSIASAFELQYSSPNEANSTGSLDHADLKYVGIASDVNVAATPPYSSKAVTETRVLFAIVTHGEWSTPNEIDFQIYIDPNEDGEADYVLYNQDLGRFHSAAATDQFMSVVRDVKANTKQLAYYVNVVSGDELDTRLFDSNVMILMVDASAIGLTSVDTTFDYWVLTRSRDSEPEDLIVDFSKVLHFNAASPGLSFDGQGGLPIFYDLSGERIPIAWDKNAFIDNKSTGLLLLHHFNEKGYRAEAIGIDYGWASYLPIIGK